MSYLVLARKWRPKTLQEVIGQSHVIRALTHALNDNRVHHAFLFTGTRGVGKTTIARIIAKCLNCERGVSASPCGECSICKDVDNGSFVDLIEVDAASRAKVEGTRELMTNVQYAPAQGRTKVYLIDEVHMFSDASFNALLKTLEEPPGHVVFLLATTDPQNIPITVLSRCLQFNLKRLTREQIVFQLEKVTSAEGIKIDPSSLKLLAKSADGSMRDALSLLDQAIAFSEGDIKGEELKQMLDVLGEDQIDPLLISVMNNEGNQLYEQLQSMYAIASDFDMALVSILERLQQLAMTFSLPDFVTTLDEHEQQALLDLKKHTNPEEVQLFYQIALQGRKDLPLAVDPRSGFEMALLRMMAFKPHDGSDSPRSTNNTPLKKSTGPSAPHQTSPGKPLPSKTSPGKTSNQRSIKSEANPSTIKLNSQNENNQNISKPSEVDIPTTNEKPEATFNQLVEGKPVALASTKDWLQVIKDSDVQGLPRQIAINCIVQHFNDSSLVLTLSENHASLLSDRTVTSLQQNLQTHFVNQNLKLKINVAKITEQTPAKLLADEMAHNKREALESLKNDSIVKSLIDTFDATLDENSVLPIGKT